MSVMPPESTKELAQLLREVLSSSRFLVNAEGDKTDVVLSLSAWEKMLSWLEDVDDREIVKEWLPRLRSGPESAGALRWEDISADWDNDTAI
jgi:hypothetical protein